jgi:hypothetical protein
VAKFRDKPYITRRPTFWAIVLAVGLLALTFLMRC